MAEEVSNVAKLSVHKNKAAQRKRQNVSRLMVSDVRDMARNKSITGYVVVAWEQDYSFHTSWESGNLPTNMMPEYAKRAINRQLSIRDAENVTNAALFGPEDAS